MERDKKNNDMASNRNNKRMWYCSHDRRLQLKKYGFVASEYFATQVTEVQKATLNNQNRVAGLNVGRAGA
jgi:hypothetical protein